MFIVLFSDETHSRVNAYTDYIADFYERLYDDTGLGEGEEVIKKQYIESATLFNKTIYTKTVSLLERQTVLGYSFDSHNNIYTVTSSTGSYRLFIRYKEYPETHTRLVIDRYIHHPKINPLSFRGFYLSLRLST